MFELEFERLHLYDTSKIGIEIDVWLSITGKSVNLTAKIDTGASYCLFERRVGEGLGFEIESGMAQRFGTATGNFLAFGHEVNLVTAELKFEAMVFFAENEYFDRNVLGRTGWLDHVILGLNDYEGKLYLSRGF